MSNPQWPSSLPSPERGTYSESWGNTIVEQEVDTGHSQTRPRFSFSPDEFSVSIPMYADEVDTFRTFYRDTLKGGALRFDWVQHRTGAVETYKIMPSPTVEPFGVDWRVRMTLKRVPQ